MNSPPKKPRKQGAKAETPPVKVATADERPTLVPCPRCGGSGAKTVLEDTGRRYRAIGEPFCWLCGGSGIVSPLLVAAWKRAGSPEVKPRNWMIS